MGKCLFQHHSVTQIEMNQRTKIAIRGHDSVPAVRDISFTLEGKDG